jgi:ribulose-phosphate 3-epimerase
MLLLTVHPGYYGAKFLRSPLKKIGQIKKLNSKVQVIVDGGMTPKTIGLAKKAGADLYVSGSFISKSDNPKKAIKELNSSLVN